MIEFFSKDPEGNFLKIMCMFPEFHKLMEALGGLQQRKHKGYPTRTNSISNSQMSHQRQITVLWKVLINRDDSCLTIIPIAQLNIEYLTQQNMLKNQAVPFLLQNFTFRV